MEDRKKKSAKVATILIGSSAFGVMMALSQDQPVAWIRYLLAAAAGGILGATLVALQSIARRN